MLLLPARQNAHGFGLVILLALVLGVPQRAAGYQREADHWIVKLLEDRIRAEQEAAASVTGTWTPQAAAEANVEEATAAALFADHVMLASDATTSSSDGGSDNGSNNAKHGKTGPTIASFSTSFTSVVQGRGLNVSWTAVDAKYEPLCLTARLINRTVDNQATAFSMVIASRIDDASSWLWPAVPYPLPYMPGGLYELELRPAFWNLSSDPGSLNVPILAQSDFFSIATAAAAAAAPEAGAADSSSSSNANSSGNADGSSDRPGDRPSGTTTPSRPGQLVMGDGHHLPTGPNKLALALGLGMGLAVVVGATAAATLVVWRRRRRRRMLEEEKRRRRFEMIID